MCSLCSSRTKKNMLLLVYLYRSSHVCVRRERYRARIRSTSSNVFREFVFETARSHYILNILFHKREVFSVFFENEKKMLLLVYSYRSSHVCVRRDIERVSEASNVFREFVFETARSHSI